MLNGHCHKRSINWFSASSLQHKWLVLYGGMVHKVVCLLPDSPLDGTLKNYILFRKMYKTKLLPLGITGVSLVNGRGEGRSDTMEFTKECSLGNFRNCHNREALHSSRTWSGPFRQPGN
jgi:hypothetical protein